MSTDVMTSAAESAAPLRRQECFFWLCAATAVLVFLGRDPLFGGEALVAEAAREASVSGRWWPLGVNFRPFSGLPLLETWSIGAMFALFGVSEFAARLPSALGVLVLLAGVRVLATSLFDRRTALLAGWLTLGSYGFLYLGRSAGGSVMGCAAVVWAVAWYCRGGSRFGFWKSLVFYLLVALGVMACRPVFLLLPVALLLPGLWRVRSGAGVFSLRGAAALLTAAAIPAAWWLYSLGTTLPQLRTALGERFADGFVAAAADVWNTLPRFGAERGEPLYAGLYEVPRIMLPWAALLFAAVAGMIARFRRLSVEAKSLLRGALLLFLLCALPTSSRWPDFLPLVPFLALGTAAGLLGGGRESWNDLAEKFTRSCIVLLAALGTVSPVALPVWRQLLKIELPVVVLLAWPITGAVVLLVTLLDSYPTKPLCKLTGLPNSLGSTILGGTLITICLISLVVPALRELRSEKPFFLSLRPLFSELEPDSVIFVGDRSNSAVMLFYTGMNSPCTVISDGDGAGFVEAVEKRRGAHLAVLTRYRAGRELEFLRRSSAAAGLKLDINAPDRLEETPPGYGDGDRRRACWLTTAPAAGVKDKNATVKHIR